MGEHKGVTPHLARYARHPLPRAEGCVPRSGPLRPAQRHSYRVECLLVLFFWLGAAEPVNPAFCNFQPAAAAATEGGPPPAFSSVRQLTETGEGASSRPSHPGSGAAREASGSADSLETYLQRLQSSYRDVRTIRADFTQAYVSGDRTRVESGVVYFARGRLMRWDYQRPQPKLFLTDGKALMLYIPEEKQLTRSPLKASDDVRIPFLLLLSKLELRRVFSRIEFAPDALSHDPADRVLRAYPKQGYEGDYQQVLMVINPRFDIRRVLVILADQSTMEFSFDHIQRNVSLSRSLFRFVPTAGTEIIDQR